MREINIYLIMSQLGINSDKFLKWKAEQDIGTKADSDPECPIAESLYDQPLKNLIKCTAKMMTS